MAISDWRANLSTLLGTVAGVKTVYDYTNINHAITSTPCIIWMPTDGDQEYSLGGPLVAHHRVQIVLYVTNQILAKSLGLAVPFIEKVRNKLAGDMTLSSSVSYLLPDEPFYDGPGQILFGDTPYIGITFNVVIKENETGDADFVPSQ